MILKNIYGQLERLVHVISKSIGMVAIGILMAMMLLTVIDVVLRKFFNSPIFGAVELIELMMVCAGFLGLGWCASEKMHICVDVIVNKFPNRLRGTIGLLTYLSSLVAFFIISWRTAIEATAVKELESVSASLGIPLHYFYLITSFGFAVLCLEIFTLLMDELKGVLAK